ncbi:MAG: tetratricopeptide repeat protein [Elusimicrobia bacterium]|nr:tetratricopeptide repeat protein [Elusimicrobiota bacterium]
MAYIYVSMVAAWGVLPFRVRVERDFKKAIALCQKIGDMVHEGGGYSVYACVGCYVNNRPKEGIEYAKRAIDILKTRGEYWDLGVGYAYRDINSWIFGRLQENIKENEEMITVMKSANVFQPLGWSFYNKGKLYAMMGNFYESIVEDIQQSYNMFEKIGDKSNMVEAQGILTFAHTRMKNFTEALKEAAKIREIFPSHYNKGSWTLEALSSGAQAYLASIGISILYLITQISKRLHRLPA